MIFSPPLTNSLQFLYAFNEEILYVQAIAGMGIALGEIFKEPTMISNCQLLETNASWGYRLGKMKVSARML